MQQVGDFVRDIYSVREVIQILRSGKRATIEVCTFDSNRKKGGERVTLHEVAITGRSRAELEAKEERLSSKKIDPNFKGNATINVQLHNGETRTIHPILIESFNGIRVAP